MGRMLRWTAVVLLGGGVGLAALVTAAVPAHACSCAQLDDQTSRGHADVVFVGRLVARQRTTTGLFGTGSSSEPTILTFTVDGVYKGTAAARQRLSTPLSSGSCGWEPTGDRPWLVFASGSTDTLSTTLCSGNREGPAPAGWGTGATPVAGEAGPTLPRTVGLLGSLGVAAVLVAAGSGAVILVARRLRRR
jgi:hypothetical protein